MARKSVSRSSLSPTALARCRTYDVWRQMHKRCSDPSSKDFACYGARGIRVCEAWAKFSTFLADMGLKPDGYSIDREEVNGNYEPRNCRWIPMREQPGTRRSAKRVQEALSRVLQLRAAGMSQDAIAGEVGIDQTSVSRLLAANGLKSRITVGRSWRST